MRIVTIAALALCAGSFACNKSPESAPESATTSAPNAGAAPAPSAPAPSAPAPSAGAAPDLPRDASAGPLRWEHRAPLVRRTPKSTMRAAEYGVAGDDRAELSVFYFGVGQGGNVESNVQRWVGQLAPREGTGVAVQRTEQDLPGIHVVGVEAAGRFGGGMGMPGMAAPQPIDDALLLGAIAEVPVQGAPEPERVYFKLVGPRDAVERAREAFQAMILSLAKTGA
jgi:pyruvate/2-oxoglutarate dehydrogenase complex dihydrolipoamide acyltransferase (E2) component